MKKIWTGMIISCLGLTLLPFHAEAVDLTVSVAGTVMTGADSIPIGGVKGNPWTYGGVITIEGVSATRTPKIIAGLIGASGGNDDTMDRVALIDTLIKPTASYPWGTEYTIVFEGIYTNPPISNAGTPIWYKLKGLSSGSIYRSASLANQPTTVKAEGWVGIPLTNNVPDTWYHVTNAILQGSCAIATGTCYFFSNPSTLSQKCPNPDVNAFCPDINGQRTLKVELRVKFTKATQNVTVNSLPLETSPSPGPGTGGDDEDDSFSVPQSEFMKDRCEKKYCPH